VPNKIVILNEGENPDQFLSATAFKSLRIVSTVKAEKEAGVDLIIDKAGYNVLLNGTKISFPKKEFELLLLLASNPRKVFKRDEILSHIWGKDFKPKDSRSLDVHIRMLRKKLEDCFITTLRGVGYKLEK
jgi:DNA-binding response OmpR family regulator